MCSVQVSKFVTKFAFQVTLFKPLLIRIGWRSRMSTTKSSGNITFRTPAFEQFHQTAGSTWGAEDRLLPGFTDKSGSGMQDRFGEKFRLSGIDISLEEFHELEIFDDFLVRHVQVNRICDVQCMLLWSEWIRNFRRRSSGFPNLIREKEFRRVITDKYGVEIANNNFRGAIYQGIKFVP
jgi:hypothetical protein